MHCRSNKSLKLAIGFIVNWHDNPSNQLTKLNTLIINFIRTPPTFIRTCTDECGNPIP